VGVQKEEGLFLCGGVCMRALVCVRERGGESECVIEREREGGEDSQS
jgi:hypothetical protein